MYTLRKILAAIAVAEPREAGITRSVIDAYELMGDDPIEALREDARQLVDILASTLRELQRLGEAQRLFVAPMKTRDEVFTLLESIEEIDDARYLKGSSAVEVCAKLLGALSYKEDVAFHAEEAAKRAREEAQRAAGAPSEAS